LRVVAACTGSLSNSCWSASFPARLGPPWYENSPMIALPGLISRRDKSPTSRNSEVVPCSSQQLNSRCGQNGSLSIASRTCGGRGSGVVVGKLLKFYIEFNCLDHERIA